MVFGGIAVDFPNQVCRQRDVEAHALGVDLREVDVDEEPEPTLIRRVSRQLLNGCRSRDLYVLAFEMHLDRFLRQARKLFQLVSSREASRKVRKCHSIGALGVLVHVHWIQHLSPPVPAGLTENVAQCADWEILARVRNGDVAKLVRMLELPVVAFATYAFPTLSLYLYFVGLAPVPRCTS